MKCYVLKCSSRSTKILDKPNIQDSMWVLQCINLFTSILNFQLESVDPQKLMFAEYIMLLNTLVLKDE